MVVHPSPGHLDNTLVNAYLYHCGRSAVTVPAALNLNSNTSAVESPPHNPVVCRGEQDAFETNADEVDDSDADIDDSQLTSTMSSRDVNALLRPGIVHRLDKGVCWSLLAVDNSRMCKTPFVEAFTFAIVHAWNAATTSCKLLCSGYVTYRLTCSENCCTRSCGALQYISGIELSKSRCRFR
jgi:hypothetical protein